MRRLSDWVVLLLVLLGLGSVIWIAYDWRKGEAAEVTYRLELLRDSLEASQDSVRELRGLNGLLEEESRAFALRAIQTGLELDSIDRRLRSESAARIRLQARLDTLRFIVRDSSGEVVVEDPEDSAREASFVQVVDPFEISADVRLLPPGLPGSSFSARLAQIRDLAVDLRIACQSTQGAAAASAVVISPGPLRVVPGEIFQEPRVCNPPPPPEVGWHWKTAVKALGIGIPIGAFLWEIAR